MTGCSVPVPALKDALACHPWSLVRSEYESACPFADSLIGAMLLRADATLDWDEVSGVFQVDVHRCGRATFLDNRDAFFLEEMVKGACNRTRSVYHIFSQPN